MTRFHYSSFRFIQLFLVRAQCTVFQKVGYVVVFRCFDPFQWNLKFELISLFLVWKFIGPIICVWWLPSNRYQFTDIIPTSFEVTKIMLLKVLVVMDRIEKVLNDFRYVFLSIKLFMSSMVNVQSVISFTCFVIISFIFKQTEPNSSRFFLTEAPNERDLLFPIPIIVSSKLVPSFSFLSMIFLRVAAPMPLFGTLTMRLKQSLFFGLYAKLRYDKISFTSTRSKNRSPPT